METAQLREIGQLLQTTLNVQFANNGHSAKDGLLQMRLPPETDQPITLEAVANILDSFFQQRGLSVECDPLKHLSMMFLRSGTNKLLSGMSVTIEKGLLVLVFPLSD
ncbi:MAG: hypothetical protein A3G57_02615 [Candidatus Andersenbacteria bacterium RIFCSPLOWO2_12_FULL_45_8]|nr:MAG: hypothetical protein A3G57_02615 [Candidatus Andersenbacteria bacterium RIFCSPLOWO2_12_FULL_45_8]